jgi:hypothetical protein
MDDFILANNIDFMKMKIPGHISITIAPPQIQKWHPLILLHLLQKVVDDPECGHRILKTTFPTFSNKQHYAWNY